MTNHYQTENQTKEILSRTRDPLSALLTCQAGLPPFLFPTGRSDPQQSKPDLGSY